MARASLIWSYLRAALMAASDWFFVVLLCVLVFGDATGTSALPNMTPLEAACWLAGIYAANRILLFAHMRSKDGLRDDLEGAVLIGVAAVLFLLSFGMTALVGFLASQFLGEVFFYASAFCIAVIALNFWGGAHD